MSDDAQGAAPGADSTPPVVPHVKLVQGGKKPRSRAQRVFLSGCGLLALLAFGTCLWSSYVLYKGWSRPVVAGESFYPEGPTAPGNVLVVRADYADPGFAEQFPILMREATRNGDEAKMPDSLKWLQDANGKNSLKGLTMYLPIVVTSAWDEAPPPLNLEGLDAAAIASAALVDASERKGGAPYVVVVQYRGLGSIVAKMAAPFLERAEGRETIEHDGMRLSCKKPEGDDPDKREVVAVGDRLVVSNRVSLAKSSLDASLAETPPTRAADDPRRLMELLPPDHMVVGLHRGRSAATIVKLFLEYRRSMLDAKGGGNLESLPPLPEPPFDMSTLDALAWSTTLREGDEGQVDFVFRFTSEAAAAAAKTALDDPAGAHWGWLSDLHVPSTKRSIERPSPLVVHVSVGGKGVSSAIKETFVEGRALEKARRAQVAKLWKASQEAAIASGTAVPAKPRRR